MSLMDNVNVRLGLEEDNVTNARPTTGVIPMWNVSLVIVTIVVLLVVNVTGTMAPVCVSKEWEERGVMCVQEDTLVLPLTAVLAANVLIIGILFSKTFKNKQPNSSMMHQILNRLEHMEHTRKNLNSSKRKLKMSNPLWKIPLEAHMT
uniref:Uncharacterized protein n=1 Tax=Cacopsylla melanoneura TaxID=428564 RepID=A0A8D8PSI5_9HEMI